MGCEAVLALIESTNETPSCVIALKGNQMIRIPMMEAVERTREVGLAMAAKEWDRILQLRAGGYKRNIGIYKALGANKPASPLTDLEGVKIGIVNIGAPAGGVNAAVRAVVRICINNNVTPAVIKDGIGGLVDQNGVHEYKWWDVRNFTQHGGTNIGTSRKLPSDYGVDRLLAAIKAYRLSGLIIIGGYEACTCARQLSKGNCPIPIIVIPATLSNNIPGTELTIGVDTSLNAVVDSCDRIKTSATGTKGRVFIIETMGGYCGYLSCIAGLASDADSVYIDEKPPTSRDILNNVQHLIKKMKGPVKRGIVIRNEKASSNYTTDFLHSIYSEEGKGTFDVRTITLGHIQQGGAPSPFDRSYATKCGSIATEEIIKIIKEHWVSPRAVCDLGTKKSCQLLGIIGRKMVLNDLHELTEISDAKKRRPIAEQQWWLNLVSMQRIMANYRDQNYHTEVNDTPSATKMTRVMSHMGLHDRSAAMKPSASDIGFLTDQVEEHLNPLEFEDARSDISD